MKNSSAGATLFILFLIGLGILAVPALMAGYGYSAGGGEVQVRILSHDVTSDVDGSNNDVSVIAGSRNQASTGYHRTRVSPGAVACAAPLLIIGLIVILLGLGFRP